MAIITVSRQTGSLGDEIARVTAEKLGYGYIEKSQISKALSALGFSLSDIEKYDEKKLSIWQNLTTQKKLLAYLFQAAVNELAARGNVVIVGRGGQVILKGVPGVLHVRIIAPSAIRIKRLAEKNQFEEKTAERFTRQHDLDSSGFLSTYFGTSWDDSELYDLVINTRAMTLNESVELIVHAVDADLIRNSPNVLESLYDRALGHKGKAALLKISRELEWINLEVKQGVATLSGIVESSELRYKCEQTISNIKDIRSVENQLIERDSHLRVY